MFYPKISIVTPTLNQGEFLEQTMCSVLDQNYPNLEYIVIDGGSTDDTLKILKKYEKHLKYWISEKDSGQSDAINKGLSRCAGDIFNWLNSDDYYEPGALLNVGRAFIDHPRVDVVCGRERAFDNADSSVVKIYQGTEIAKPIEELIYEGIIDQPPTFFRKSIVDALGRLPVQLHFTMDSYWWTLYLLTYGKKKVIKIDDILTNFRLHDNSKGISRQDLFTNDRNVIRLALATTLHLPGFITEYLSQHTTFEIDGLFEDLNASDQVSLERLTEVFCRKIFPVAYYQRRYDSARKAFLYYVRHNKGKEIATYQNFVYFLKLILLPEFFVEWLRRGR